MPYGSRTTRFYPIGAKATPNRGSRIRKPPATLSRRYHVQGAIGGYIKRANEEALTNG